MRSSNSYPDACACARCLTLFIAGFFLIQTIYAIDPNRAMSQYVRDHWGAEQGFPPGPLYAITQTRDGYLWIGTGAGLVRFDGWNFRLVHDPSGLVPNAGVVGLTPGEDNSLWILLENQILLRYHNGVFERQNLDKGPFTHVSTITTSTRGLPLISKMEDGVFELQAGGAFRRVATADELPRSPVISLAQTPNGDVWMGTRDAGLFRDAGGKIAPIRNGLPDLKINCVLPDSGRALWIGTDNGIVLWNGIEITRARLPVPIQHFQALVMVRDRDANIWAGTDSRGLLRLNPGGAAQLDVSDSTSQQAITALFEDREGDLWIGHAGGVDRLRDSPFVTYSSAEGIPAGGSNPVFVDSEQRIWFPPTTGGLWWVKGKQHGNVINDGVNHDVVYSIDGDSNYLWAGRQRGGLTRIRLDQGSISSRTFTQSDGLAQDNIYSVYVAHDGTVWAGTLSAGLSMLRDGKFTNFSVADGLASNTVSAIVEGAGGTMWFATPGGVSARTGTHWITYGINNGLPSENINCLFVDSSGVVWAGTASGIAFRRSGSFQVPPEIPPQLKTQILGVTEDKFGALWIATSRDVMRVNRQKLIQGAALERGDLREFGLADGLRGLEGAKRQRSVLTDSSGRVWFSLNHGISVVDPARFVENSAPALVHVQSISADGELIPLDPPIHVPGGHQRITFGYSGLSLAAPDRVLYRYWLEGYDHGWSSTSSARDAAYTNLPPRRYRLRVMATNPDGQWSADEAVVPFEVDPLLWQTWWFRFGCVLTFALCIFSLYQLRLRQLARRINLRYQERLAERTRIAQELHDKLLQGFLSASMQVHLAFDSLPENSKGKATLDRALALMKQVIEEGRNALRGLRSSETVSLDLEPALSRIQSELAALDPNVENVDFRVIVDGQKRPLHPLLRDEVYRILREAVINAFRHARAKNLVVEFQYSGKRLSVRVRDDGRGIDPNVVQAGRNGHGGLSLMRERAERIGAELHVMSSSTAGTEIVLSVPGPVAFSQTSRKPSWLSKYYRRSPPIGRSRV